MARITCPCCGETFELESAAYLDIISQVRTQEFEHELSEREKLIQERAMADLANFEAKANARVEKLESDLAAADVKRIADLKQLQTENAASLERLKAAHELSLSEKLQLEKQQRLELEKKHSQEKNQLDLKLHELEAKLNQFEEEAKIQQELAITQATSGIKEELLRTQGDLEKKDAELKAEKAGFEANLAKEREGRDEIVRIKDAEIERLKDYRMRQTIKMTGESLEQHCWQEFNTWRSRDPYAFKNITFEKDNEAIEHSKGDFIYREYDEDGSELLTIMFEMKNEEISSTNKKTNESHFAKLDGDRKKKHCEYAVLVSMLELDSDYYNQGIVDVSYAYPKMYVIRPQFFLTLIALLRSGAYKSRELRAQIAQMKSEQIDITNFEDALMDFQGKFTKRVENANKKFSSAIDEIDKAISNLQKVKDNLLGASNHLRIADNSTQNLTIKKLTRKSPLLAERFAELEDSHKLESK